MSKEDNEEENEYVDEDVVEMSDENKAVYDKLLNQCVFLWQKRLSLELSIDTVRHKRNIMFQKHYEKFHPCEVDPENPDSGRGVQLQWCINDRDDIYLTFLKETHHDCDECHRILEKYDTEDTEVILQKLVYYIEAVKEDLCDLKNGNEYTAKHNIEISEYAEKKEKVKQEAIQFLLDSRRRAIDFFNVVL